MSANLIALWEAENASFINANPRSKILADAAKAHWHQGVPMHWMKDWDSPFPLSVKTAAHAKLQSVDGIWYDDFCLGDTPSMYGHARIELTKALSDQLGAGIGYMLPTETSERVGRALSDRFGLSHWQVTTTASDANRCCIAWARAVTGRSKILAFDGCYHGMVEDTYGALIDGDLRPKPGLIGMIRNPVENTKLIDFNDLDALEAALRPKDVAAIILEPVMTNCGMIPPQADYLEALETLAKAAGTLVIYDETHTLSSSHRGYVRANGLRPDMLVIGKAIAGGIPAAVYGFDEDLSVKMNEASIKAGSGSSGLGTTLSGNALAVRAIDVMLSQIITAEASEFMNKGALRLVNGLNALIAQQGLNWCTVQVGGRVELIFAPKAPLNANEMRPYLHSHLMALYHLYLLNRGLIIAPFHNMMLISPVTDDNQIDNLIKATGDFAQNVSAL